MSIGGHLWGCFTQPRFSVVFQTKASAVFGFGWYGTGKAEVFALFTAFSQLFIIEKNHNA